MWRQLVPHLQLSEDGPQDPTLKHVAPEVPDDDVPEEPLDVEPELAPVSAVSLPQ